MRLAPLAQNGEAAEWRSDPKAGGDTDADSEKRADCSFHFLPTPDAMVLAPVTTLPTELPIPSPVLVITLPHGEGAMWVNCATPGGGAFSLSPIPESKYHIDTSSCFI